MAAAFLDLAAFRELSTIPGEWVDAIERQAPGFVSTQLQYETDRIRARLRPRYADFVEPYPLVLQMWLAKVVTLNCMMRRGFNPTDPQSEMYLQQANDTWAELKEAADAKDGLYDLPLRADTTDSGATKNMPLFYSETSPYVGRVIQRQRGTDEDSRGEGSSR